MALIDFGHFSNQSRDGQVGAASLVNCYTELVETSEQKTQTPVYCCPGLTVWDTSNVSLGPLRGSLWLKNYGLFAVQGNTLIQIITPGVTVNWGAIPGTGPVTMAANQRQVGPQIGIVTNSGNYYLADTHLGPPAVNYTIPNDPAAPISDGKPFTDFPPPASICAVSNYFIFAIADGRIFQSGLNDGTTVNPLAYDFAQISSNGLVRAVMHRGILLLLGPKSYEIWQDAGTYPFSFAPIRGDISVGILAFDSVVETGDSLIWVDHEGKVQEVEAAYPARISNHAVERAIASLTLEEKQALRGTYYFFQGHRFYSLSSDGNFTFEYNLTTKLWHQRETYGLGCWLGRAGAQVGDITVMGSFIDGTLYSVDGANFSDGDTLSPVSATGQIVHDFPDGLVVDRIRVDCVRGVGTVDGNPHTDTPMLMMDFSRDGGRTWEGGFSQSMGAAGDYTLRVDFRRIGAFREGGVLFRFSASAPVFRAIMNVDAKIRKLMR